MERRDFVRGSLAALASTALAPAHADAQRCPPLRAEWDASAPPLGREPASADALTDEERSHVPVLTLPRHVRPGRSFDLVVQIGLRPHESTAAHHIDWVEVCLDTRRVAVIDLTDAVPYPIVRIPIVVPGPTTLVARGRCTQHGVWMTRRAIETV